MPAAIEPSGGVAAPGLVDSALTALKQGMNPYAAVVFAMQQAFGLKLPTPPGGSPPAPAAPSLGGAEVGLVAGGGGGGGGGSITPQPTPPPPPPPNPCSQPQACPDGWYWSVADCGCVLRTDFGLVP